MVGVWKPFSQPEYKKPWRLWSLLKQFGRDIRWSHQRIWKGYCEYDLFSIDDWFLKIMPQMLSEFQKTRHGSPVIPNSDSQALFLDDEERNQDVHTEWDKKLDRMVFLLREMDEATCSQRNTFEDAYFEALKGHWETPIENADGTTTHRYTPLGEIPEYKELDDNYRSEEKRLTQYRLDCKREFFELFSEHFYDLWD